MALKITLFCKITIKQCGAIDVNVKSLDIKFYEYHISLRIVTLYEVITFHNL